VEKYYLRQHRESHYAAHAMELIDNGASETICNITAVRGKFTQDGLTV